MRSGQSLTRFPASPLFVRRGAIAVSVGMASAAGAGVACGGEVLATAANGDGSVSDEGPLDGTPGFDTAEDIVLLDAGDAPLDAVLGNPDSGRDAVALDVIVDVNRPHDVFNPPCGIPPR
jgi:hypothetical protein